MAEIKLEVEKREGTGKKIAKRLRREGKIPGIYYQHGKDNIPIVIDRKTFSMIMAGDHSVIDLKVGRAKPRPSILREVQWDPVSSQPIHVDFLGVNLDEKVVVEVPVHLSGDAIGVKNGGVQQFLQRTLEIECLPLNIPEYVEVDVTDMDIQDSKLVKELELEDIRILTDEDAVIVSILPPRLSTEDESAEAAEEQAAEPELVEKGKKDQEEGA